MHGQTSLAVVLLGLRWAFSAGLSLMAIRYTLLNPDYVLDPEAVMPVVLQVRIMYVQLNPY